MPDLLTLNRSGPMLTDLRNVNPNAIPVIAAVTSEAHFYSPDGRSALPKVGHSSQTPSKGHRSCTPKGA
jgi:hypothetical protein